MRFSKIFHGLFDPLSCGPRKSVRRRRASAFPNACELCEERVVLSAPNIINLVAPTQLIEGQLSYQVQVTFDCDDIDWANFDPYTAAQDALNTVRWSEDGGVTWSESQVYNFGNATETHEFASLPDQGTVTWDLEITDSEGLRGTHDNGEWSRHDSQWPSATLRDIISTG